MRTRSIRADELESFVEAGTSPEHREDFRRYVEDMFAAGSMRPKWCFVIEEGSEILGRVALWKLPPSSEPLALVLLDVSWDGDHLSLGLSLLRDVLGEARSLGAREIEHVLDAPPMYPQWQNSPEKRTELLERAGFSLKRETSRFEWREEKEPPSMPGRLTFRTLEEVGEEAFIEAMMRVSGGTLDREIQDERERMGPKNAARDFFEWSGKLEYDASWWQLAYTPGGDLVGLVMPAKNPTSPVIDYIGVVPEQRGKGYVDDLLARGTAILHTAGAKYVRADTDTRNAPMAEAFRRAGYVEFARRREYGTDLTQDQV